ncbi:hypothetical protein QZH41_017751, partial [Actinostola sp. cb2023]
MEAKEAKLSSSMRSIKMFWSPELKKERAARKSEAEKYTQLKEQFNIVSKESQQRTEIIQDLQGQLKKLRQPNGLMDSSKMSPASSLGLLSSQENLHKEVESLRLERELQENEGYVLQKTLEELSTRLENQQQALLAKDETIARMMEMFKKGQENKHVEQQESGRKVVEKYKAEMDGLKAGMVLKDQTISSLQEEISNVKIRNVSDELCQSANLLAKVSFYTFKSGEHPYNNKEIIDSQIADLESQMELLQDEIARSKSSQASDDTKRNEEKKQAEVYQSHSQFLKSKVESLKADVAKKEAALNASEAKVETFKAHHSDQQQHISVLQSSLQAKDHHIKNLQSELESLRGRLDDRESCLKDKEKMIDAMSSEHSENSYAVENLKSVIDTKERQATNLRNRCESLESELLDKDSGMSTLRAQLSSLRGEHQDSATTITNLEATIRDKDRYIEMLQTQRQRNGIELNEEVENLKRSNEKLESKVTSLREELYKKEDTMYQLDKDNTTLQSSAQEKTARLDALEQTIKRLERDLDESTCHKDKLASELSSKKLEITRLEKVMKTATKEVENIKVAQETSVREDVQKLKDECAAKDRQIEDLEKFVFCLQKEVKLKDERIAILEEALKESVTIAAEREELLAQQAHSAETAVQRVDDIEMELDRTHLEMAITNTKNASLLLALNENDAILNYYKSERRHNLEDNLEMRQNALLATISEKDANIALLELTPTRNSENEVVIFKREKDKLVNELKDQTQRRITLINNEDNKEVHLSMELVQAPKDKVIDAIALIEDSMEKLQLYADDLLEIAKSHFPEVSRKLPKLLTRDYGKYENAVNKATENE